MILKRNIFESYPIIQPKLDICVRNIGDLLINMLDLLIKHLHLPISIGKSIKFQAFRPTKE